MNTSCFLIVVVALLLWPGLDASGAWAAGPLTRKQYIEITRQADALAEQGLHDEAITLYLDVLKRGFAEDKDSLEPGAYGLIAYHYYMKGDYKSSREWELRSLERFGPGKDNRRLIDTTRDILRTYGKFPEDCPAILKLLDDLLKKVPEPDSAGGEPLEAEFGGLYKICGDKQRHLALVEAELARLDRPDEFREMPAQRRKTLRRANLHALLGEYRRRRDFDKCGGILKRLQQEFPEEAQMNQWLEKQLLRAQGKR